MKKIVNRLHSYNIIINCNQQEIPFDKKKKLFCFEFYLKVSQRAIAAAVVKCVHRILYALF